MAEATDTFPRIHGDTLKQYVIDVFTSFGMRQWDAEISADILVESLPYPFSLLRAIIRVVQRS